MLTPEDISAIIQRPVRFVREKLLKTGVLRSVKFGASGYRVRPQDFTAMIDRGATGFNNARPSGRWNRKR